MSNSKNHRLNSQSLFYNQEQPKGKQPEDAKLPNQPLLRGTELESYYIPKANPEISPENILAEVYRIAQSSPEEHGMMVITEDKYDESMATKANEAKTPLLVMAQDTGNYRFFGDIDGTGEFDWTEFKPDTALRKSFEKLYEPIEKSVDDIELLKSELHDKIIELKSELKKEEGELENLDKIEDLDEGTIKIKFADKIDKINQLSEKQIKLKLNKIKDESKLKIKELKSEFDKKLILQRLLNNNPAIIEAEKIQLKGKITGKIKDKFTVSYVGGTKEEYVCDDPLFSHKVELLLEARIKGMSEREFEKLVKRNIKFHEFEPYIEPNDPRLHDPVLIKALHLKPHAYPVYDELKTKVGKSRAKIIASTFNNIYKVSDLFPRDISCEKKDKIKIQRALKLHKELEKDILNTYPDGATVDDSIQKLDEYIEDTHHIIGKTTLSTLEFKNRLINLPAFRELNWLSRQNNLPKEYRNQISKFLNTIYHATTNEWMGKISKFLYNFKKYEPDERKKIEVIEKRLEIVSYSPNRWREAIIANKTWIVANYGIEYFMYFCLKSIQSYANQVIENKKNYDQIPAKVARPVAAKQDSLRKIYIIDDKDEENFILNIIDRIEIKKNNQPNEYLKKFRNCGILLSDRYVFINGDGTYELTKSATASERERDKAISKKYRNNPEHNSPKHIKIVDKESFDYFKRLIKHPKLKDFHQPNVVSLLSSELEGFLNDDTSVIRGAFERVHAAKTKTSQHENELLGIANNLTSAFIATDWSDTKRTLHIIHSNDKRTQSVPTPIKQMFDKIQDFKNHTTANSIEKTLKQIASSALFEAGNKKNNGSEQGAYRIIASFIDYRETFAKILKEIEKTDFVFRDEQKNLVTLPTGQRVTTAIAEMYKICMLELYYRKNDAYYKQKNIPNDPASKLSYILNLAKSKAEEFGIFHFYRDKATTHRFYKTLDHCIVLQENVKLQNILKAHRKPPVDKTGWISIPGSTDPGRGQRK